MTDKFSEFWYRVERYVEDMIEFVQNYIERYNSYISKMRGLRILFFQSVQSISIVTRILIQLFIQLCEILIDLREEFSSLYSYSGVCIVSKPEFD